ncbi:septal ring lytic transglycosylase RlpA family protein [Vreelandella aquamarina]
MKDVVISQPSSGLPAWLATGVLSMGLVLLSGCAGKAPAPVEPSDSQTAQTQSETQPPGSTGGRYAISSDAYPQDPPDVSRVPDAEPRIEPLSRAGNRPTYEVWGETYHVLPDARGYVKEGTASWYGEKFHGYATSNGEIYDMYKMSAAHRSLPLPTFARVTSLDNGESVIVRVNDRGPFHSEREIDLSYAAAYQLGFTDAGTGRVKVEAIDPQRWLARSSSNASQNTPDPTPPVSAAAPMTNANAPSIGYLQVAALGDQANAEQLRQQLENRLSHGVRVTSDEDLHRVQVGPVRHAHEEQTLRDTLRQAGYPQVFIVK